MASSKSTKRALIASALVMVVCVSMFVAATFAWFTDTASTSVNKITSGNLSVAIQDKEGNELTALDWVTADSREQSEILWEPGCTYTLTPFKVVNTGNLALKYKITITGLDGDSKLLDAITFTYTDEDGNVFDIDSEGHLAANAETSLITVSAHMDEASGSEYSDLTLDSISFTVCATQDTVEYDSYNNTYDSDAKYTEVIAAGKTFSDGGTHTLNTGVTATDKDAAAVKASGENTNVIITDGTFDGGEGGNNRCIHVTDGATVTIKDGTFTVGGDATGDGNSVIYTVGGNVVIEGGFFYTPCSWNNFYYVLNQSNSNPGTITVKGGTFVNYDPSKGDDNLGGNFVATGYKVVSETQANGDVWYTVVAE